MSSAPPVQIPPLAEPPARGGCLRAALIGCGAVALLLILALVGVVLYAKKNPGLFLDVAMRQIEKGYGPDVTEADKQELRAAVAEFKEAIASGRISGDRSAGWQRSFTVRGGSSSSGKFTHQDVQDLIRSFKEAVGEKPAPGPTLTPAPRPSP